MNDLTPEQLQMLRIEKRAQAKTFGDVLGDLIKDIPHSELTDAQRTTKERVEKSSEYKKKFKKQLKDVVKSYFNVHKTTRLGKAKAILSKVGKALGSVASLGGLGLSVGFQIHGEKKLKQELNNLKISLKNVTEELKDTLEIIKNDTSNMQQVVEIVILNDFRSTILSLKNATFIVKDMFPGMHLSESIPHTMSKECSNLGLCRRHVQDIISYVVNYGFQTKDLIDIQTITLKLVITFNDKIRAAHGMLQLLTDIKFAISEKRSLSEINRSIKSSCKDTKYRFWDNKNKTLTHKCPDYHDKDIACIVAYILSSWEGVPTKSLVYNCISLQEHNVLQLPVTVCPKAPVITQDQVDDKAIGIITGLLSFDPKMKRKRIKKILKKRGYRLCSSLIKCTIAGLKDAD